MMADIIKFLFVMCCLLSFVLLVDGLGDYVEEARELITKTLYATLLEELNGAHLRIAATNFPNTLIIKKNSDGTFSYSGYVVDFVQYMADLFHFNYTFIHTRLEDLQKMGPRDTEVNFLLRNEADIAVTRTATTIQIFRQLDISIPLFSAGVALLVPWPEEESRLLAPIRPFQSMVWLIFFVSILIMALITFLLPGIYDKLFDAIINPGLAHFSTSIFCDKVHGIAANVTGHSGSWPARKQLFYRILLGSWFLASFVLVAAYSSLLISYLTIPTLMPVAKNYDDLAFNPIFQDLAPITDKNSVNTAMMSAAIESNSHLARRASKFAEKYKQHPEWLFTTAQQRFDLLYAGRAAHGLAEPFMYSLLDELNKKAGYCKITVSTKHIEDLFYGHYVFLFQKHWRYTDAVRNKMQWWSDTGLAMHWLKNYQPSPKGCLLQDYKENVPSIRVLTLKDLSSAFVLLLLGLSFSLLGFLVEKIRFYIRIHRG